MKAKLACSAADVLITLHLCAVSMILIPAHVLRTIPVDKQACLEVCCICADHAARLHHQVYAGFVDACAHEGLDFVHDCSLLASNAVARDVLH